MNLQDKITAAAEYVLNRKRDVIEFRTAQK